MSDDRAIEVLAERLEAAYGIDQSRSWAMADALVEALASAGLQITDLTPEEAKGAADWILGHRPLPQHELRVGRQLDKATAKLRRLSGGSG